MFKTKFIIGNFGIHFFAAAGALSLTSACGDGGDDAREIVGDWVDDFDVHHQITEETWTQDGPLVFHIVELNNSDRFAIAENDAANAFNPDQWSRFEWTWDGNDLYYCQVVYDAADEQAARAADSADADDLAMGCNDFSWSALTPE